MASKLILASASPRRQQLLSQFDIPFDVVVADIDETPLPDESPDQMTIRLAIGKAQAVSQKMGLGYRVLGGDTTVALRGVIMGKPADKAEAIQMLKQLSGQVHDVHSAVALVGPDGCFSRISTTQVHFHELQDHQIARYCNGDDPYDKAGAYGIQGPAGQFVRRIDGSYSAVIGLPLWKTHQLLFTSAT